ncbi:MAG: class I SAM-dependent methyltransferase [Candidatus Pacebacteria bacterium]|nr:class I SAM-dependent methyltransferase [Candidatus Paceibacterota bacterium]
MYSRLTREDWDEYATHYDALNRLRPYVGMLDDVHAALTDATAALLDVGCGTGNLIARISSTGAGITGIDYSPAMIGRAREKCPEANFLIGDSVAALPFADESFTSLVCCNVLYALSDPAKALTEFFRVLKPNGSLVLVTPKRGFENGLILKAHSGSQKPGSYWKNIHASEERERMLITEAVDDTELASRLLQLARINRTIAREPSFHFFTRNELLPLVSETGFKRIHMRSTYARQNHLLIATRATRAKP